VNWLSSAERYELYGLHFLYKYIITESSLNRYFPEFKKKVNKEKQLKSSNDLFTPTMKTTFGQKSYFYQMILIWNKLPYKMKGIDSFKKFDNELRKILLSKRKEMMISNGNNRIIC
jgi:hypothetical protein